MKGIAHFAMGVAAASCFPEAVAQATAGNPLYFILGGVFGLLPDTLDFKLYRFFYRHDVEVTPDPLKPDPRLIADAVALAVRRAVETGRPVNLKLDTIRLGADRWQSYEVSFDVPNRRVIVRYGPVVDTGGNPEAGSEPARPRQASAALAAPVRLDYLASTRVDILEGPMFRMTPDEAGVVTPVFIPWHRQWSHSVTAAALFALLGGLLGGWLAAGVIASAALAHVLADQLGYMGSNLWFPLTARRSHGLRILHAQEPIPNLMAVWLAALLVFWNLVRALPPHVPHPDPVRLFAYGGFVPVVLLLAARRLLRRRPATPGNPVPPSSPAGSDGEKELPTVAPTGLRSCGDGDTP